MESAERLEPSTAAQISIRSTKEPTDSPPTKQSKRGHFLGMVGNHGLGISSVSGVFPMMHHSGFSSHSSAPAHVLEFGGLGTLGMSMSLSARSQLGALQDWWRSADAQGQGSAVLFPHLLGLPALFGIPSINQEHLISSRSPKLNSVINGNGRSSSASSKPSSVLTASDQTRCPKPAVNLPEEKSRHKTSHEKLYRKLPDVSMNTNNQSAIASINNDSQSECTSDSLSESLDSSDSDDLDDDDDDEDNQTDDSMDSECGKDLRVMKKVEMQTDNKKNYQTAVQDDWDHCSLSSQTQTNVQINPFLLQVLRPSEEPSKHTSVIQTTDLSASTNPVETVTHKGRDIPSSSLKTLSSSTKPLSMTASPKPSPKSPSPEAPPLRSDHLKSDGNYLNKTLKKQPFLPQEPIKQLSSTLRDTQMKISPPSLSLTLESQSGSKSPSLFNHHHSNLFLPFSPMESHHTSGVQDAPLALITKPRSKSSHTPDKHPLTVTSSFNTPINLSMTGALVETHQTSTSSLTSGAIREKGCTFGQRGVKRERPALLDRFRKAESDRASSDDSDDSVMDEENNNEVSNDSLSDSDSILDSDSEDDEGKHEDVDPHTEAKRMKHKPSSSALDASRSPAPLNLHIHKTPEVPMPTTVNTLIKPANHSPPFTSESVATPPGKRRRVTDETVLQKPLEYGWQRETRITNTCGRLRGVVVYYAPCGRRIRQYPEVMKYLNKHRISDITRDHFSFSAKIKVGNFYEARDEPQGSQWCLLKEEEVVGRILAMEGRRGRPRNPECSGDPAVNPSQSVNEADGLSVSEIKLLRRLEAQEIAQQAAQMKLIRKLEKQALTRAAKEARRQQAIMQAEERRKQKEHMKILKQQEKMKRIQQIRMEKELRAQQILEAKRKRKEEAANAKILEAARRLKEKELRRQQAVVLKLQELERHRLDMERERHRQHVMLMKTMEARKKAEEKERVKQEKRDEKERRLELRRLELEMNRELNKPNEDMCLTDQKPLPALSRIPGLVLPGQCFSDCLMVLEFLRCFGKVLGFDISSEVPSLAVLQAGLLNVGDHMTFIQDLLVRMLSAAVCDPGFPPGYKAKTALGDLVTNVRMNRGNVSEMLQIYMEAHCGQTELAPLAESLKTKAFQTHTPSQKAAILAFLTNELTCSKTVISEIDKNIDSMTSLRRDKRLIEGNLRKLKRVYSKMTGKRESSGGMEERQNLGTPATGNKRKRKAGESDDDEEEEDEDSDEQGEEDEDDYRGKRGKKADACEDDEGYQTTSIEELEKQIERLSKQQSQVRQKLFKASHSLRSVMFGQDRYKRRYWVLPQCGGVFVEAMESGEGPEELQRERKRLKNSCLIPVKEEPMEIPEEKPSSIKADVKREPSFPKPQQDVDSLNLFLQKPGSFSKLIKQLKVAKMSSSSKHQTEYPCSPSAAPNQDVQPGLFSHAHFSHTHHHLHHDQLYKVLTERKAQWFSLLPRSPCDVSSLPCSASSSSSPQNSNDWVQSSSATSPTSTCVSVDISNSSLASLPMKSCVSVMDLPSCTWSNGNMASSGVFVSQILNGLHPSAEENVFLSSEKSLTKPSPVADVSKHQDFPSPQPIPGEMLTGWWRVTDIEELRSVEKACHSRGIREKVLQKQLQKHIDYITQLCAKNRDVTVINVSELEEHQISEDIVHSWCVDEQAMDVDISVLQQVEELERRVTSASLQVKGWMPPAAQSHSEQLVYHEHKPLVKNSQSDDRTHCDIMRRANNPLDIAVIRLGELERNIERRYLNSPLISSAHRLGHMSTVTTPASASSPAGADGDGADEDLSPGLKQWRKALGEVRSSSQLFLCIQQLHKSIAWEKSIMKVYCQICRKGDDDDRLLLCDGCDGGCHTYCHKPKISIIPAGDWFCPVCTSQASSQSLKNRKPSNRSAGEPKKLSEVKRNGRASVTEETSEDDSGCASSSPSKVTNEMKKRKIEDSSIGSDDRDNSEDVTMCRMLLTELESHQDAWPFLRPVDPKSVPGYRKVIRKPMDFSTIRDKLTNSQYLNLETFIIDVNLVFNNCEKFNKDNSDVGRAGHTMRRFFQDRWTELLGQKL